MSELERIALALVLALFYLAFSGWCYRRTPRSDRDVTAQADVVIAYASQSGRAHQLAEKTRDAFSVPVMLYALNQLTVNDLGKAKTLLVVASTYGEGEAPDNAIAFARRIKSLPSNALSHLNFVVLGLGDSHYQQYCAFAYQLQQLLVDAGANPIAEILTLDAAQPEREHEVIAQWQIFIATLGGQFNSAEAEQSVLPAIQTLQLTRQQQLNSGSPGAPLYWLRLESRDPLDYQAGDIAEVYPRQSPDRCEQARRQLALPTQTIIEPDEAPVDTIAWLAEREWRDLELPIGADEDAKRAWLRGLKTPAPRQYTIACARDSHALELVVRQQQAGDNLGLASGWLTRYTTPGEKIQLSIRNNSEFHTPPKSSRLILIGNGSGIAGLRAHLQERAATGGEPCWLIFGERDPFADALFYDEFEALHRKGVLQRIDRAYSKCPGQPRYVQDCLQQNVNVLCQWIEQGAYLYVCGSRLGMAQAVHDELNRYLGESLLQTLQADGRYCRDVY
ncbi:flavodoxin domain-containing protein [Gilvimarinus sp. 1_MG-2023]|uniref:flavodoxin domain-containing protein n=1 Tax=Gilvimarinus sp. 1_MG-2023 TaxID=3062638 RepID=UPI0026E13BAD|nr:flavodoxin domain-containing protein [Gilvimarinus sp. 1_MG-2023]MDO6745831.1 flavodoxin domain-containing protein [Gilvimarinus sp. 1_MG-2023]